jgi:hypothetical protein
LVAEKMLGEWKENVGFEKIVSFIGVLLLFDFWVFGLG